MKIELASVDIRPESLAREFVAFASHAGGTVLLGIEDNGQITGVARQGFEEWLANIARNNVVPALNVFILIKA